MAAVLRRATHLSPRQRPALRAFTSSVYRDPLTATFNPEDLRALNAEVEGLFGPLGDPDYESDPPLREISKFMGGGGKEPTDAAPTYQSPSARSFPAPRLPPSATGVAGAAAAQESAHTRDVPVAVPLARDSTVAASVERVLLHHKAALEAHLLELLSLHLGEGAHEIHTAFAEDAQLLLDDHHHQVAAAVRTELRLQTLRRRRQA